MWFPVSSHGASSKENNKQHLRVLANTQHATNIEIQAAVEVYRDLHVLYFTQTPTKMSTTDYTTHKDRGSTNNTADTSQTNTSLKGGWTS